MTSENDTREPELEESETPSAEAASETEASAERDPAELARERDDYLARWQRAAADYKNLRRRTADDIENAVRRATVPLLGDLLLVLDHLELALSTPVESEDAKALHTGVKLTRDQFQQVLERNDLARIKTAGPDGERLPFDPAVHEAVAAIDAPDAEPGEILDTVRRGYTWRGQVLRHAHVVVAKAGTDEASSPAQAGNPQSPEA